MTGGKIELTRTLNSLSEKTRTEAAALLQECQSSRWISRSCRKVIADGVIGFLVNGAPEAGEAIARVLNIDRAACQSRVQDHFSIKTVVAGYEQVQASIFKS